LPETSVSDNIYTQRQHGVAALFLS
jgi:hypothetical protein